MLGFLDLPRELRDMIYIAAITAERPAPVAKDARLSQNHKVISSTNHSRRGEYGSCYCTEALPPTVANWLACNRQVHDEMREALCIVQRDRGIAVKLDCIAQSGTFHYFTWLSIPVVKTNFEALDFESKPSISMLWFGRLIPRLLCQVSPSTRGVYTTNISCLWVDVRSADSKSSSWFFRAQSAPDRTALAVCAAVNRILENGPDFRAETQSVNKVLVEELVLNAVSATKDEPKGHESTSSDAAAQDDAESEVKTMATELSDVWQKIWAGRSELAGLHQLLIKSITRVRVCVDGKTWRTRELAAELERGQAERRRSDARGGGW